MTSTFSAICPACLLLRSRSTHTAAENGNRPASYKISAMTPDNHNVVRQHLQHNRATLRPVTYRAYRFAVPAFDRAEHSFRVPALGALLLRETTSHHRAIVSRRQLLCSSSDPSWDDRSNTHVVTQQLLRPLRVVPRIERCSANPSAHEDVHHQTNQLRDARRRSTRCGARQDDARTMIDNDARLGKATIRRLLIKRLFQTFLATLAPANEVAAAMMCFEAVGTDRCQGRCRLENLTLFGSAHRLVVEPLFMTLTKQPRRSFLQRREVRHVREVDRCTQVGAVLQQRDDAAIVKVEDQLQHETREELMLRKLLRTEAMNVPRQQILRDQVRGSDHHLWRFAGLHSSA